MRIAGLLLCAVFALGARIQEVPRAAPAPDVAPAATAAVTVSARQIPDWIPEPPGPLSSPILVYLLLLGGLFGLLAEGHHPGMIVPGVAGGLALLVAIYALQFLDVNYSGLVLILLGIGLMVAEAAAPGLGLLGGAGITAFVIGSIWFIGGVAGSAQWTILALSLAAALLLALLLAVAWRARRKPVVTGREAMVGEVAELLEPLATAGSEAWARVRGERWRVRAAAALPAGAQAKVTKVQGLLLTVEPVDTGSLHTNH
jgi:membrane-bound serine protease (ClpP class)